MRGTLGRWLQRARNRSLADADRVVAIGEAMADRIAAEGIASERLRVIHNWADGAAIVPREQSALRAKWGLSDVFVAQYSGNLGRVHEFDTLLDAASLLRDDPSIRFVIVGQGPRHAGVRERAEREQLRNVTFLPLQPRGDLAESLGVGDVHVSVLDPRFDGLVLPSKLYGILAAGRPVVFIGDPRGESATLIASHGCGVSARSGDAPALAAALRTLRDDTGARLAMGRRAREAFERDYDMPIALSRWRDVLADLGYKRS
jgi:glycosyltransferase involved in cell wall biosynthesis